MNTIKVKVNFTQGTCETTGINLITGDYNSTKIEFTFDREDGTKVFEMKSPSEQLVMVQEIENNEIILYGEDDNENIASIFTEEGYYVFEISLYENESKLTSAKGKLKVKPEQVVIDDEVVEAYLPVFDQLLSQVNTALAETSNLDISASKSDHTTTITITDKEGQTSQVEILDGEQGPAGENGEQGPQGEQGPAGRDGYVQYTAGENITIENNVISATGTDLTDYVKFTDFMSASKSGVAKLQPTVYGLRLDGNGFLTVATLNYAQYGNINEYYCINKGTLENVIAGKGLVSNTDYPTNNGQIAGVLKTMPDYGLWITNEGILTGVTRTASQFSSLNNNSFISKGTLENVLTARSPKIVVITESDYNALTSYEDNTEYHIIEG